MTFDRITKVKQQLKIALCCLVSFFSVMAVQAEGRTKYYNVDYGKYPNTMEMVCVVMRNGQQVTDCELAAFVGGELSESAVTLSTQDSRIFLSVQGERYGEEVTFKVVTGTASAPVIQDGYATETIKFVNDAELGTYDDPIVIYLTNYDVNKSGNVSIVDVAKMIDLLKKGDKTYILGNVKEAADIILKKNK